ncbi:hypothetical protein [Streptosporangium jomthongense]|uniref:Uncharacterized protein n=1 Tax=Streptosporangium jomthongense TaxID=1193683 RepID=A0ABV8FAT0_9ACTN
MTRSSRTGQRMRISRVRLGRDEYRVLWPDRPPRRAFLFDDGGWALAMYVDGEAAAVLAVAWGLAARSRHSLVHLPMRANLPPEEPAPDSGVEPLDLVLVHHSMRFPPSRWPAVRARLGTGRPHTVSPPGDVFPDAGMIDHDRVAHREYHDHLHFAVAARTLFVVGGPEAFLRTGATMIRPLVTEAPAHLAERPDGHFCAEIDFGRRRRSGRLHVEYRPTWAL